jgi:hypothetical protein
MNRALRVFLIPVEGKVMRVGVWDGRKDYSNIFTPEDLDRTVGGPKMVVVQVGRPTNGFEGRSSLELTKAMALEVDSVVHWAKNTKTFNSIVEELSKAGKDIPS